MCPKLFLGMAVVILVGYVKLPFWSRLMELLKDSHAPRLVFLVEGLAHVGPLIPLVAALARLASPFRFRGNAARTIAGTVVGAGLFFSFFAGAFSGAGSEIVWLYGFTLTLAVAASVLLLADDQTKPWWPFLTIGLLLVPFVAAIWSLAAGVVIYRQAEQLSGGQPYCIAHHNDREDPVSSLADLRGLMFYTTFSGYKDSSHWYFHGLLLVGRGQHLNVFNWSPRHLRFDLLQKPQVQFIDPRKACRPRLDFLKSLKAI